MKKPVVLLGLGGHAKVLIDVLELGNYEIKGYAAPSEQKSPYTIPYLGKDEVLGHYDKTEFMLINTLGSTSNLELRKQLFNNFKSQGYLFATLIHPKAYVSNRAIIGEGVQLMAGAIVQPFAVIGDNSIINSNAVVEHDSLISSNCHIAPGVTISGGVKVGECTHIGTGASVIQDIQIEDNVVVGAGAVVIKNVSKNKKMIGVPAKEVKK
ncbi:acetyltransferase [Alkalicoccus halolimnae]|uniref:Acetyltransferase n=1 Tax=Alkalicoccus halolimnae TaxID=1667239 RepID=A0A5C7FC24_9BACI|nr:acetyltransferase [Alkalicoccus halolimnae]TXF87018.1 acetyltransferase [Alkalicoccus halolimnae]